MSDFVAPLSMAWTAAVGSFAWVVGAATTGDTVTTVLITALASVAVGILPGVIALRRSKRTEDRSADRQDFEALVQKWELYAQRLETDLARYVKEVEGLRDAVRKCENERAGDRANYEAMIAQLKASLT